MKTKQSFFCRIKQLVNPIPQGHEYFHGEWHGGIASYTYIPDADGKVQTLDGNFDYRLSYSGGRYDKVQGHMYQGKKDGDWMFTHKGNSQRQLKAHFLGGRLSGLLEYTSKEESIGSLWQNKLIANLENDCILGQVEGVLFGWKLSGYCDQQGLADGEWTLSWTERGEMQTIRREQWSHGVLQSSVEEDLFKKKRLEKSVNIARQVNLLFDSDIRQLMKLMPEGSRTTRVRIIPEE